MNNSQQVNTSIATLRFNLRSRYIGSNNYTVTIFPYDLSRARTSAPGTNIVLLHAYLPLLGSPSMWNRAFLDISRCLSACRITRRDPLSTLLDRCVLLRTRLETPRLPSSLRTKRTKRDAV